MAQFVCVRVIQTNGVDLRQFQFDFDLTFAAILLNADGTVYGRYGSRSNRQSVGDISLAGFRAALAAALELHCAYPANRTALVAKRGPSPRFPSPELYPSLRGRFKAELDYAGEVARGCIHCHQVWDAERELFRSARQAIPDAVLFPHPAPEVVGLRLDTSTRATVRAVTESSPAARAGFRPQDELMSMAGQPIVSMADLQWVLHQAPEAGSIETEVRRGEAKTTVRLELEPGWRRASDISWRTSTWDLRRMGTGGLVVEHVPVAERAKLPINTNGMALRVKHVGQFGEHAAAKRAGFQQEDVLVEFDGQSDLMTETALLAHAVQKTRPKDHVPVTVLRGGNRVKLVLPMQ
jgi:hypothetical protein